MQFALPNNQLYHSMLEIFKHLLTILPAYYTIVDKEIFHQNTYIARVITTIVTAFS